MIANFGVGFGHIELTACLRTGRVLRVPSARERGRGKSIVSPEIMISQHPAEAADQAVPGHWEGDLMLGSAISTLVEHTLHDVVASSTLLRQYFPKGTDLSIYSADEIAIVAAALDAQPRKTLCWKTPAAALDELLA